MFNANCGLVRVILLAGKAYSRVPIFGYRLRTGLQSQFKIFPAPKGKGLHHLFGLAGYIMLNLDVLLPRAGT